MTQHPTAITPEGWRIGAGFSEFLHGVGHGALDELFEEIEELESAVCQHGRDDYCRPCLVRERAEELELGL